MMRDVCRTEVQEVKVVEATECVCDSCGKVIYTINMTTPSILPRIEYKSLTMCKSSDPLCSNTTTLHFCSNECAKKEISNYIDGIGRYTNNRESYTMIFLNHHTGGIIDE